jgi:quinol-cytochrome oxidoreductase complex cytochrome b subunit
MHILHVLLISSLLLALVGTHLILLVVNKHTQFKGPGRTKDNVVGSPLWPVFIAKTLGFFFIIAATLAALGAFVFNFLVTRSSPMRSQRSARGLRRCSTPSTPRMQ